MGMHPALYSWRDELSDAIVRWLACVCGAAFLAIAVAHLVQPQPVRYVAKPAPPEWVDIEKPFPAFALSVPEAADAPASYAIKRNRVGGGRKDILSLGDSDGADPYLRVEVYRPGSEISRFAAPTVAIAADAAALGPVDLRQSAEPLPTKFGPLTILTFNTAHGTPRQCLGFVRSYEDPMLQLSGRFCRGGEAIDRATLACALGRLTLLSAGSEPKVGALFADAELRRSYCGQRDPILAATPKYHLLWKALEIRPLLRRIDR
jgi:hypothetical protein